MKQINQITITCPSCFKVYTIGTHTTMKSKDFLGTFCCDCDNQFFIEEFDSNGTAKVRK